jgi:hypothetical protein
MRKRNAIILACAILLGVLLGALAGAWGTWLFWADLYRGQVELAPRHGIALCLPPLKALTEGKPEEAESLLRQSLAGEVWAYDLTRELLRLSGPEPAVVRAARERQMPATNSLIGNARSPR